MADPTDLTLASYQEHVDAYLDAALDTVWPIFAAVLDDLVERSAGGRVLEIGSGPGTEARYLEERGLEVDRTDATPAFVERLQRSGYRARLLDIRHGDLGGPYDAVLANAVLLHLERSRLEPALAACHAATRPGGHFLFTLKEGDGEGWSTAKLDAPRWFVYWREPELRRALDRAGWDVIRLEHAEGRNDPWLLVLCRRPQARSAVTNSRYIP